MDTVGADLKTSLGRVNEKGKTRNSECGMLPCEKSQETGDEMQISVLLFAYRNTVSHRKSGKWLDGQGHE